MDDERLHLVERPLLARVKMSPDGEKDQERDGREPEEGLQREMAREARAERALPVADEPDHDSRRSST